MKKVFKSRFFYMVIVGIIIQLLLGQLASNAVSNNVLLGYFISIFITFLVWEGAHRIDKFMNRKLQWEASPLKRVLIQAAATLIYSVATIYLVLILNNNLFCQIEEKDSSLMVTSSLIIGVLVTFILVSVQIGAHFFKRLKYSLIEIEVHKKDSLQAQLENLRTQINPHFLFNNLSVLSSLIYKDQEKAVDFIEQFSKVYRYVLENKENELVELNSELKFIDSYCYLLKIRFGDSIKFNFDIGTAERTKFIPPMALQLLLENAIKHNEVSEELPLTVKLFCEGNYLLIENEINLRKGHIVSSNTGLKNIISRYSYYTKLPVIIKDEGGKFIVKIPILESDKFD